MARQHLADATIESLNRVFGLQVADWRQPVLDPVLIAQAVENMLTRCRTCFGVWLIT